MNTNDQTPYIHIICYNKAYCPEARTRVYNVCNNYFTLQPTQALFIKKKSKSVERVEFGPGASVRGRNFSAW